MPVFQALPAHKTTHENGGADEIDATGLTGAGGGGGGGGLETVGSTGSKFESGRDTLYDNAELAAIFMSAGEVSIESSGNDIGLFPDNGQVVDIGSGDGLRLPRLAADPASPATGQTYYNTVSNKLRCWDGSAWQVLW